MNQSDGVNGEQEQLLETGLDARHNGRLAEAENNETPLLESLPDDIGNLRKLAQSATEQKQPQVAQMYLQRLVALQPENATVRHDHALVLAELGLQEAAIAEMREADRLQPRTPEILNNLGCLLKRMGQPNEAVRYFQQAILVMPENAILHANLGGALGKAYRFDEAIPILRTAATLAPNLQEAWASLGAALLKSRQARAALGSLRRAVELRPEDDESLLHLADALQATGQAAEALSFYVKAAECNPESVDAWCGLGRSHLESGRFAEAIQAFQKCLSLDPLHAPALHECGKALFKLGCIEQAMKLLRQAAQVGTTEIQALALQNLAVIVPGSPVDDNRTILETRQVWGRLMSCRPMTVPIRDRASQSLRIGYVSSFFHRPNWMKPVWALINHHDRQHFQIHLFSDAPAEKIRHGYRPDNRDRFHDISGQSNESVARLINEQEIDILVDLNGYSQISRLPLFLLRPAPILVGWFNMYATTGLDCFDYLIGDQDVIPAREEPFYTERILRVPHSYLTFEVDHPAPDVTAPPVLETGQLTMGCLASQYKITDQVIETWAGILHASPHVRMLIRNSALGRSEHQDHLSQRFATWKIPKERLLLEGPGEHFNFLATYGRIDFAVDTFPYSGGTTTMEALWQGVPVVTFNGNRWASRTSVSLLKSAGLDSFVASNRREYVEKCVQLANSHDTPERLRAFRADIRQRLRASPVCDSTSLARSIECLYLQMAPRKRETSPRKTAVGKPS